MWKFLYKNSSGFSKLRSVASKDGFTLIELVIVITLIAIVGVVVVISVSGGRDQRELQATTVQIGSLLREMQSKAMAQASSSSWGVRFENATATTPFFASFVGDYSTSTRSGYYILPRSLSFSADTVSPGDYVEVSFSQLSGSASSSKSINIYLKSKPSSSSTITVATSGLVTY